MAAETLQHNFPDLQPFILNGVEPTGKRLGMGSFGAVEELRYKGAFCAGKRLHEQLIDPGNEGIVNIIERFKKECQLMSTLRHPNIVQFMGLCFVGDQRSPMLVMERLHMNLSNLIESRPHVVFAIKVSILFDVSKGLYFLHSHEPQPIIHRDLTAPNVLLTASLQAKISDLGNSRMISSHSMTKTYSQFPGTMIYMPPEATVVRPKYDARLDLFSFGHLSLYTTLCEFPTLALAVFTDPADPNKVIGRTEVERRMSYMEKLYRMLGEEHILSKIIRECLHNSPERRPSARHVMEQLEQLKAKVERQDVADVTSQMFSMRVRGVADYEEVAGSSRIHTLPTHWDPIKERVPRLLRMLVTEGMLRRKVWKEYKFQLADSTLKYFKRGKNKGGNIGGKLQLSDVVKVVAAPGDDEVFEVVFVGQGSPWLLRAYSKDDRTSWMEAILPGSSGKERKESIREMQNPAPVTRMEEPEYEQPCYQPPNAAAMYQPLTEQYLNPDHCYQPPVPKPIMRSPSGRNLVPPQQKDQPSSRPNSVNFDDLIKIFSQEQIEALKEMFEKQGHRVRPSPIHSPKKQVPRSDDGAYCYIDPEDRMDESVYDKASSREQEGMYEDITSEDFQSHLESAGASIEEPVYDDIPLAHYENLDEFGKPLKVKKPDVPPKPKEFKRPQTSSSERTASVIKAFMKKLSKKDLLASEEDEEECELRPDWAKASIEEPKQIPLSAMMEETLYISRTSLHGLQRIGEGHFGEVLKAILMRRGRPAIEVAVKRVKYSSEAETNNFKKEMAVTMEMMHPNIVRLFGLVREENWLVLEYLDNGNLKQFLAKHRRPVSSLVKYMMDIAMGMHYLTEKGLVHRDLAARNILLDGNEVCKVSDFGLLRELPKDIGYYVASSSSEFPIRWMAPESILERKFSPASDVWSFGIVQWEMFHPTKLPYQELEDDMQCAAQITQEYTMVPPKGCPKIVARIMKACWFKNPRKRPSFLLISGLLANMTFQEQ